MNEKNQLIPVDVERQKKEMQALIETVLLTEPGLAGRLNVQVVWNYLQLPDASFGWIDGWKGDMPWRVKMMAVAAHLKEGATPGFGQIYYLGNKLYKSADFVRGKANSDPNFVIGRTPKWRPHTKEEKDMFGLVDGDMSCRLEMIVTWKGTQTLLCGDGIIGKDELDKKDKNGKPLPGKDTTKNRAATLKTRAMRDLYKYFYPSDLPIGGDANEDAEIIQLEKTQMQQLELPRDEFDLAKTREKIKDENISSNNKLEIAELKKLLADLSTLGLTTDEVSEMTGENWDDIINGKTLTLSYSVARGVLSDLIISRQALTTKPKEKVTRRRKPKIEAQGDPTKNDLKPSYQDKEPEKKPNTLSPKIEEASNGLKDDPLEKFIGDIEEAGKGDVEQDITDEEMDSYEACDELLDHENVTDAKVIEKIISLKRCSLLEGDRIKIYSSVQNAVFNKDFRELDALITARSQTL